MKKLLTTLLVLITIFTATTCFAASIEDKLTQTPYWMKVDIKDGHFKMTDRMYTFTKKNGSLTYEVDTVNIKTGATKFKATGMAMVEGTAMLLTSSDGETIIGATFFAKVNEEHVMMILIDTDGHAYCFIGERTAVFDEVI